MGLNWKSVKAVHVTQACEALLNSAGRGSEAARFDRYLQGQTASGEGYPPHGLLSRQQHPF